MHGGGGDEGGVYMRNLSKKIQPSIMFCTAMCLFRPVTQSPFPPFPSFQRDQCEGLSKKDTKIIRMALGKHQPAEASQGVI